MLNVEYIQQVLIKKTNSISDNAMKNKTYYTVGIVPKSKRKTWLQAYQ
jgi:hypothetical protein